MTESSTQLRSWWDRYRCAPELYVHPEFYGHNIGGVPPEAQDAYFALELVLQATGYDLDSVWAFNCRKIGGGTQWSLHAYGIAIDIDAPANPYTAGDPFTGKFTETQVAACEAIRSTHGGQVWAWGGRWGKPDRMHWQINVPPTGLEIDWDTVEGANVAQLNDDELKVVQDLTVALHDVQSNGWFPKTMIPWYRANKTLAARVDALEDTATTSGLQDGDTVTITRIEATP